MTKSSNSLRHIPHKEVSLLEFDSIALGSAEEQQIVQEPELNDEEDEGRISLRFSSSTLESSHSEAINYVSNI